MPLAATITDAANFDELIRRLQMRQRDRVAQLFSFDPRVGQDPRYTLRWEFAVINAFSYAVQLVAQFQDARVREKRQVHTLQALQAWIQRDCEDYIAARENRRWKWWPFGNGALLRYFTVVTGHGIAIQEIDEYLEKLKHPELEEED